MTNPSPEDSQHIAVQPTSERPTIELCSVEARPGLRCILRRGHHGSHEAIPLLESSRVK